MQSPEFVRPSSEGFRVDDQIFPWGTTLAALSKALDERGKRHENSDPEMPRALCKNAYGFAAVSFEPEPRDRRQATGPRYPLR